MANPDRACAALLAAVLAAASRAGVVEPDLAEAARKARGHVRVVVMLRRQHMAEAMAAVAPRFQPAIDRLAEEARQAALAARAMPSLDRGQEDAALAARRYLVDPAVLRPYAERLEALRDEMVGEAQALARHASVLDFAVAAAAVRAAGGAVRGQTLAMSAVLAELPAGSLEALARSKAVAYLALDRPGEPELNVSVPSIGAASFWGAGVAGGPHDAGILDTGVQQNHPAFAGKRFESNAGAADTGSHGTAVASMTCSGDATYRGVAFGIDTVSVALAGGDSTSMAGMNYLMTGVAERAENVNYSFGNGTASGSDYASIDRFFDGVADTFGVMVSKSTGNGGFSTGAPTITHPAPAYNILAVGALDDLNTVSRADDRIASYSSTGPTLGGRKKPDVSAPGSNILAALPAGGYGNTGSGTSYAAPHAGGSILLLAGAGSPSRLASKAVLVNTAQAMDSRNTSGTGDDVPVDGSFWDRRYGWGYIDLGRAWLHAPDVFERTLPAPPAGGRTYRLFVGGLSAAEKATLAWNRHVAFNGPSYPTVVRALSNLDLAAYTVSTGIQAALSASTVDNVEQLAAPASATYVLKVYSTGQFDPALTGQRFALATQEGFAEALGPSVSAEWLAPLPGGSATELRARVRLTNVGDLPAFGVVAELKGARILGGPNPVGLGTVAPGGSVEVSWAAKPGPGLRVDVTSLSYGEAWSWSLAR